jgi:2-C-methyl-D-erythritol 4-phosphate cytidylyltransferase
LGGNRPKQFLELGGVPIVIHALRQFERCAAINEIVAVLPAEETAGFSSLAQIFGISKLSRAVAGGPTRAQSMLCGLAAIDQAEFVAVHDGARPFVTPEEIEQVVMAAQTSGAAVLVAPVADTIKELEGNKIVRTIPRANLRRALTPQCFGYDLLKRAAAAVNGLEAAGVEVTDESILIERLGVEITAVEGSARNIKITRQEDLGWAEVLLKTFSWTLCFDLCTLIAIPTL